MMSQSNVRAIPEKKCDWRWNAILLGVPSRNLNKLFERHHQRTKNNIEPQPQGIQFKVAFNPPVTFFLE